jgi:hypothetical protein
MKIGGVVVSPFFFFGKTSLFDVKMRPEVVRPLEGHSLGCRVLRLSCVSPFLTRLQFMA